MPYDQASLADFLVAAKRSTYASQNDEASIRPVLNGSKQLEYRRGDYFYRDIYFGFGFFAGQETVEYANSPIWSMVYSGGVSLPDTDHKLIAKIYAFLRQALRQVDTASIYRGPNRYASENFLYENEAAGALDYFHGKEQILMDGQKVYELRYNGGLIR